MNQKIAVETARGDALAADKAKAEADLKALGEEMEKQIHQVKATAVKDLEAERALRSDSESKLADSIRKELEIKAEEAEKKAEVCYLCVCTAASCRSDDKKFSSYRFFPPFLSSFCIPLYLSMKKRPWKTNANNYKRLRRWRRRLQIIAKKC